VWAERELRLVLDTQFPQEETVRLLVHTARPQRLSVRVRIPYWCAAASAQLNGRPLPGCAVPGSYLAVERRWRAGDVLTVRLPMHLHLAPMPDDSSLQAVMYGPLVLAGHLGTAGLDSATLRAEPTRPRRVPEYRAAPVAAPPIVASAADPSSWLEPLPHRRLAFRTSGQAQPLTLEPLNGIFDERYAVYWKVVTDRPQPGAV
jgi:DUF1680 family protein